MKNKFADLKFRLYESNSCIFGYNSGCAKNIYSHKHPSSTNHIIYYVFDVIIVYKHFFC